MRTLVRRSGNKQAHLCAVEDAQSVVRADDRKLPVHAEVDGGDELRLTSDLIPERHLLIGDRPQSQLAVQRATQEVTVILQSNHSSDWPVINAEISKKSWSRPIKLYKNPSYNGKHLIQ